MSAGDLRLSRSRHSVRSIKRQAPRPPGPPPKALLHGLPPESVALLHRNNIEHGESSIDVEVEPHPRNITPSAPSITPPPDMFRSSLEDLPPPPPPLLNHRVSSPMVPYRRRHGKKRKPSVESPMSQPDPAAPLSLLALDESYTQPPMEEGPRRLSRNYNSPSPMAFDHGDDDRDSLSPQYPHHRKQSVSPQSSSVNNQSASDNESTADSNPHSRGFPHRDSHAPVNPGEDYSGHDPDYEDTDDDMLIMRPARPHNHNRGRQAPVFTGYSPHRKHKDSINSNDMSSMTYFNPGDED